MGFFNTLFHKRWVDRRDDIVKGFTFGIYDPKKARREEAETRYAVQDQTKAYKEATAIAKEETDRKRGELESEKKRVEAKQVRALRGRYRPAGFLNNQATVGSDSGDLSNKLGA